MTKVIVTFILLFTLSHFSQVGQVSAQDQYVVDNSHSSVVFAVSHYNLSYTYGRFNKISGDFVWNQNFPSASHFRFQIDANSIDTNDQGRDQHLRGPDFFDTQQFSTIDFKTRRIEQEEKTLKVYGDLTLHGSTREIMIPMHVVGIGKGPFGKERAGFYGKFTVRRSDFGMQNMMNIVGDKIAITLSFEGIKSVVAQQASVPGAHVQQSVSIAPPVGDSIENSNEGTNQPIQNADGSYTLENPAPNNLGVDPGAIKVPDAEDQQLIPGAMLLDQSTSPATDNSSQQSETHPTFFK